MVSHDSFLVAALTAAGRGWCVFPLVPNGKTPALREWERRATTDRRQICRWWADGAANNIGVATGRSGLVVLDLDDGRGQAPPARFAGARNGRDALAMLAAVAGAGIPADTYEVMTPGGGSHLYFRAPVGLSLRNTVGSLAWKIDSRAHGGYCVAAGSVREQGVYRVARDGDVGELPGWLARALTPVPHRESAVAMELPSWRASAYVRAIVESEARVVATARTGTRHHTLLRAARTLGRLVGGGELIEDEARIALLTAAGGHIGIDGCTTTEVHQTIGDGLAHGKRLPRRITRGRNDSPIRSRG